MNRKLFMFIAAVAMVFMSVSCGNSASTEQSNEVNSTEPEYNLPDLQGEYLLPAGGCDLKLIINKEKNDFDYAFQGMNGIIDMSGKIIFSLEGDSYRLNFDGPIENNPPKTVEGVFKDKTITIQNYGNADQKFTVFSDCQEKFLEFTKK